jgi:peptidoglycan/xylan/chitin deacetylase (PgdA/CDA1 family)
MKNIKYYIISVISIFLIYSCCPSQSTVKKIKPSASNTKNKLVNLTFDDLPFATNNEFLKDEDKKKLFSHIVKVFKKYNIKATGFLIGGKYDSSWFPYMKQFLIDGHTLGNHTYSHYNSNEHTAEEYIDNIAQCDSVLADIVNNTLSSLNLAFSPGKVTSRKGNNKMLYPSLSLSDKKEIKNILTADKKKIEKLNELDINIIWKYFRYPYLNRGETEQKKMTILSALDNLGYKIAPVTITSNDWRFNPRYETAYINKDSTEMAQIAGLYLSRIKRELFNSEDYSQTTFHREVKQIMLFHLNVINCLQLENIIELMLAEGYQFVELDNALDDELYQMADGYSGSYGVPWLYRAKRIRSIKK